MEYIRAILRTQIPVGKSMQNIKVIRKMFSNTETVIYYSWPCGALIQRNIVFLL